VKSVNIEVELSPNCHMKCTNADFCELVLLILNFLLFSLLNRPESAMLQWLIAFLSLVFSVTAFSSSMRARSLGISRLNTIPLELEGELNPENTWEVKFIFDGEEKTAKVSEGDSLLESAEKLFGDAPSSCRNGVCTTCAAQIVEGRDSAKLAVHGLGEPQIDAGFVCSCQTFPIGEGITVKLNMYDECYESQYGQYENSYDMKFSDKKEGAKKNKLFGF
jgi:ferredoxin